MIGSFQNNAVNLHPGSWLPASRQKYGVRLQDASQDIVKISHLIGAKLPGKYASNLALTLFANYRILDEPCIDEIKEVTNNIEKFSTAFRYIRKRGSHPVTQALEILCNFEDELGVASEDIRNLVMEHFPGSVYVSECRNDIVDTHLAQTKQQNYLAKESTVVTNGIKPKYTRNVEIFSEFQNVGNLPNEALLRNEEEKKGRPWTKPDSTTVSLQDSMEIDTENCSPQCQHGQVLEETPFVSSSGQTPETRFGNKKSKSMKKTTKRCSKKCRPQTKKGKVMAAVTGFGVVAAAGVCWLVGSYVSRGGNTTQLTNVSTTIHPGLSTLPSHTTTPIPDKMHTRCIIIGGNKCYLGLP